MELIQIKNEEVLNKNALTSSSSGQIIFYLNQSSKTSELINEGEVFLMLN
jgi:hypothetical protein